jgi:hypothetical protein
MIFCGRRRAASLLLAMASAGPTAAQQPTAEAFLASIYAPYLTPDFKGRSAYDQADRLFVPDLANAMKRDAEQTPQGMVGALDWDPFSNDQQGVVKNLSIVVATDGGKVTGHVSFDNFAGKRTVVVFDLARTPAGWRIADIKWPGNTAGAASMRTIFKLR